MSLQNLKREGVDAVECGQTNFHDLSLFHVLISTSSFLALTKIGTANAALKDITGPERITGY